MSPEPTLSAALINKILGEISYTEAEILEKYPPRGLAPEAMVTRVGPSPTGFMHLGGLYTALICERLAHQTGGVFFVRIEDTDKKREVEGALATIINALDAYGITVDEGPLLDGTEKGMYGPYLQSQRTEIYKPFIKNLLENGAAYPCFCSTEELEDIRKQQEAQSLKPGYYGKWAIWRNASEEKVQEALAEGKPCVIRLKADSFNDETITIRDILKGNKEIPANDQDIVLLKSDGTPTYHFAHVVDDYLMRTTDVIRGDEWFVSTPIHLQLFAKLGWVPPRYGHLAPLQKSESEGKRRKLSKRSDPEANVEYYAEAGYPPEAIIEYLLNLADSNFEEWRNKNPETNNQEFKLSLKRLSGGGGALLDLQKLNDTSKNVIARMPIEEVWSKTVEWAAAYRPDFATALQADKNYSVAFIGIESNSGNKRKGIATWAEVEEKFGFFLDTFEHTEINTALLSSIDSEDIKRAAQAFMETYDPADDRIVWFEKVKKIAGDMGYAENMKALKEDTEGKYKGYVADIAKIFRVFLANSENTPDLYEIMSIMGKERVMRRIQRGLQAIT